jgi:hypothetical protein
MSLRPPDAVLVSVLFVLGVTYYAISLGPLGETDARRLEGAAERPRVVYDETYLIPSATDSQGSSLGTLMSVLRDTSAFIARHQEPAAAGPTP